MTHGVKYEVIEIGAPPTYWVGTRNENGHTSNYVSKGSRTSFSKDEAVEICREMNSKKGELK